MAATNPNWSRLLPELVGCILENLSITDFHRARTVCTTWNYASKLCKPKPNQIPWLILFTNSYPLLFNPEEEDKVYTMRHISFDLAHSSCLASSNNWLLMLNPPSDFYLLNVFTCERINLPSLSSRHRRQSYFERFEIQNELIARESLYPFHDRVRRNSHLNSYNNGVVMWVDEATNDYIVLLRTSDCYIAYSKKGDDVWKEMLETTNLKGCRHMAYKNHKLYIYNLCHRIRILDFSGEFPREVDYNLHIHPFCGYLSCSHKSLGRRTNMVVTMSGDVMMVIREIRSSEIFIFHIFQMNSKSSEWKKVDSLGDEAMILDLGITVAANEIKGMKKNSIYVSEERFFGRDVFVFDIATCAVERFEQTVFSSIQFHEARWFFPS